MKQIVDIIAFNNGIGIFAICKNFSPLLFCRKNSRISLIANQLNTINPIMLIIIAAPICLSTSIAAPATTPGNKYTGAHTKAEIKFIKIKRIGGISEIPATIGTNALTGPKKRPKATLEAPCF